MIKLTLTYQADEFRPERLLGKKFDELPVCLCHIYVGNTFDLLFLSQTHGTHISSKL
jgi:hypothetical protein